MQYPLPPQKPELCWDCKVKPDDKTEHDHRCLECRREWDLKIAAYTSFQEATWTFPDNKSLTEAAEWFAKGASKYDLEVGLRILANPHEKEAKKVSALIHRWTVRYSRDGKPIPFLFFVSAPQDPQRPLWASLPLTVPITAPAPASPNVPMSEVDES